MHPDWKGRVTAYWRLRTHEGHGMTSCPKRIVLKHDPDYEPSDGQIMDFRLIYSGPLRATQRDPVSGQNDPRANHKHDIRRVFHRQLKQLWATSPLLTANPPPYDSASLARKHAHFGFNFVPLVTYDLDLICGLDILFLRPDKPGDVVWHGDIDNRLKTLFDAMRIPTANENYSARSPLAEEQPLYCLLEEDKLITKLTVETDDLLERGSGQQQENVHLIITAKVRPLNITMDNLSYG